VTAKEHCTRTPPRTHTCADGNIPNARSLAVSGNSKVTGPVITYVSALTFDPSKGPQIINAMVDLDGKGLADYVQPITSAATFEGALKPNGIAWCALHVTNCTLAAA
jgi:uncharacterized OB-fold protein